MEKTGRPDGGQDSESRSYKRPTTRSAEAADEIDRLRAQITELHERRRAAQAGIAERDAQLAEALAVLDPAHWLPEKIAQAFHEAYERLAPQFGYETREASAVAWENVPAQNKALMTATVAALLASGVLGAPADQIRAEVWDEARAATLDDVISADGYAERANPYRGEATGA